VARKGRAKPWLHKHGPLGISATPVTFPDLGYCMYCGATARLTDEHPIPFAMDGNYILPKSVCEPCRVESSRPDDCARTMFGAIRTRWGMQTRRLRDRVPDVDIYPLSTLRDPDAKAIGRGSAEEFASLVLPTFRLPRIIDGRPYLATEVPFRPVGMWLLRSPQPLGTEGLYGRGPLQSELFARMIAKAALGLSIGAFAGRFRPLVREMVLGQAADPEKYVGSAAQRVPATPGNFHWNGWALENGADGRQYLSCAVRLFSGRGAPIYQVVVGDELQGFTTPQALEEETRALNWGGAPFIKFTERGVEIEGNSG
jgi:hypothetical protein